MTTLPGLQDLVAVMTLAAARLLQLRPSEAMGPITDIDSLKTEADAIMHRFLCDALQTLAPAIPVISEEDSWHPENRPDTYFLIDPIDGTASFVQGFDGFVTQVACLVKGEPFLAVLAAPALGLLYAAGAGNGASCNGRMLGVNTDPRRLVLTDNYPEPRGTARRMMSELGATGYLESGSIALKICRVADGSADLFFKDVIVRDWDVAPADLVLSEAGGKLCLPDGSRFVYGGDFVKPGLVSARDNALASRCVKVLWAAGVR